MPHGNDPEESADPEPAEGEPCGCHGQAAEAQQPWLPESQEELEEYVRWRVRLAS